MDKDELTELAQLRKQLKKQRTRLSPDEQQALSQQAVRQLYRSRQFRAARHIALYLPVRGEADPTSLRQFIRPHQRLYLPVLSPAASQGLIFVAWNQQTRFRNNRFNIPEPSLRSGPTRKPSALDLVITPLLGFDQTGNRLGMGGGFYDRSFAFKRHRKTQTRPLLIGFAYPFQQVGHLKRRSWDVPLNAICTSQQFATFMH